MFVWRGGKVSYLFEFLSLSLCISFFRLYVTSFPSHISYCILLYVLSFPKKPQPFHTFLPPHTKEKSCISLSNALVYFVYEYHTSIYFYHRTMLILHA
ncbi:hypothetical protein BX666DRAFT_889008 [Dichotomocladium elegans]|nr:hypothetical protein BX666DRAFT_889008 [Dichotomocladium elegans]